VAPRVPPFGETMEKDDERARAGLRNVHVNSVGIDLTMSDLCHDLQINQFAAPAGTQCPGRCGS
jgi:hypothetical protein